SEVSIRSQHNTCGQEQFHSLLGRPSRVDYARSQTPTASIAKSNHSITEACQAKERRSWTPSRQTGSNARSLAAKSSLNTAQGGRFCQESQISLSILLLHRRLHLDWKNDLQCTQ